MERNLEPYLKGDEFVNWGEFSNIHLIENHPEYIAKEINLRNVEEWGLPDKGDPKRQKEEFLHLLKIIKTELNDYYPEFHMVWGQAKTGEAIPIIFMKKVTEEPDWRKDEKYKLQYVQSMDDLSAKLGKIYRNTYQNGVGISFDLKGSNVVFGKTNLDKIPRLYMVDMYPAHHWPPNYTYLNLPHEGTEYWEYSKGENFKRYFPKTMMELDLIKDLK